MKKSNISISADILSIKNWGTFLEISKTAGLKQLAIAPEPSINKLANPFIRKKVLCVVENVEFFAQMGTYLHTDKNLVRETTVWIMADLNISLLFWVGIFRKNISLNNVLESTNFFLYYYVEAAVIILISHIYALWMQHHSECYKNSV